MSTLAAPRLSFIVPAFNAEATLADTLESLVRQTEPNWEAIVVDDGSRDNTAAVARAHADPRIHLIHQHNRGLAGARNTGLAAARAPHVAFLDADDVVTPDFTTRMLAGAADRDAVACAFEFVGPALRPLGWTARPALADLALPRLVETNAIACTCVVSRDAIARLAPGRAVFNESLPVLEDWDLWLRLTGAGLRWAAPVAEPMLHVRLRPLSLSTDWRRMHETGREVISRAPVPEPLRAAALRRWDVRSLAAAMARRHDEHAARLARELAPLTNAECDDLAAAFAPERQRRDAIGPGEAHRRHAQWCRELRAAFPELAPEVFLAIDHAVWDWTSAARAFAASLRPGERAVIYGMGANGRAALAALANACPAPAWIDDDPAAACPLGVDGERLTPEHLSKRDVVLVTPARSAPIEAALTSRGIRWLAGHAVARAAAA